MLLGEGARLVLPGRFDSGGQYRPSVLGWIHQLDRDVGLSAGDVPCSEHLALDLAQATKLVVWEFLTEQDYDLLWVNGQNYSYTDGTDGVLAEGQIGWTSDTSEGWSIFTAAPTPSPTGPISVNGTCEAEDRCVSSQNDLKKYGTLLSCNITFWMDATLHGVEFETELGFDTMTVEGVDDSRLDSSVSPCLASLKLSTPLIGSWVRGSAWCTKETGHATS